MDGGILKYDTDKDEWSMFIPYPQDLQTISHAVVMNKAKTKFIFITNKQH